MTRLVEQRPRLLVAACMIGLLPASAAAQSQPRPRQYTMPTKRTERAYPTGDPRTSVVLMERTTPEQVRRGQPFDYEIKLTNLTDREIRDVELAERFPPGFDVAAMSPRAERSEGDQATWRWAAPAPRAVEVIRVRGSTQAPASLSWCATVTLQAVVCAQTEVVEPALALDLDVDPDILRCDPLPIRVVVANRGTGVAQGVMVNCALDSGLMASGGRSALTFQVGDLAAGQTREFVEQVSVSGTGTYTISATATESGGLTARDSATTRVVEPRLELRAAGPAMRFIGRPATFELTVTNQGDVPAERTMVEATLPAGTNLISADGGGRLTGGVISWNLGTLDVRYSSTLRFTVSPTQQGMLTSTAVARAVCAQASTSLSMEVRGIPAVLLEVVDVDDPIEVGSNETYMIEVTNQGSAMDTNILIACALPAEQSYVSSSGPTTAIVDGLSVRFAPLPSLAPKTKVVYRVVVRGTRAGDVRFQVTMDTDQLTRPVQETESTNIYQ